MDGLFSWRHGRTREQPHSEKLWLAFAEFQDEFLAMNRQAPIVRSLPFSCVVASCCYSLQRVF
jgi:hypothetical protein